MSRERMLPHSQLFRCHGVVVAWYGKNLLDKNAEQSTEDGAHIFCTRNGATLNVELGERIAPGTNIGLVRDAKQFWS